MTVSEFKEIVCDITGFEKIEDVIEAIVCDQIHNQAVCINANCGEVIDIEPDVAQCECPDCGRRMVTVMGMAGMV